jgi:hypothetical protein
MKIRVGIRFVGKLSGALGRGYKINDRRTIEVPEQFTMDEAVEAARKSLYYAEEATGSPAYESVFVHHLTFN